MLKKLPVTLCLGSSCFARGNQELIAFVRKYIAKYHLEDKVDFKGDHCFNSCSEGPNIMIGSRLFQHVGKNNIETVLTTGLEDLLKSD